MKKRMITAVTAGVLALGLFVAGTVAYLTRVTDPVTNTFTVGNIEIELEEPEYEEPDGGTKLYPGVEVSKDPTVTIKANSEKSYIYLLLDNQLNFQVGGVDVITLDIHADWTAIATSGTKTLYRYHLQPDTAAVDQILTPLFTTLTVDDELVTSDNIGNFEGKTIQVTAYAHQFAEVTQAMADAAAKAQFGMP